MNVSALSSGMFAAAVGLTGQVMGSPTADYRFVPIAPPTLSGLALYAGPAAARTIFLTDVRDVRLFEPTRISFTAPVSPSSTGTTGVQLEIPAIRANAPLFPRFQLRVTPPN